MVVLSPLPGAVRPEPAVVLEPNRWQGHPTWVLERGEGDSRGERQAVGSKPTRKESVRLQHLPPRTSNFKRCNDPHESQTGLRLRSETGDGVNKSNEADFARTEAELRSLDPPARLVLAVLAVVVPASLSVEQLGEITEVSEPELSLAELERRGLVVREGDRYTLAPEERGLLKRYLASLDYDRPCPAGFHPDRRGAGASRCRSRRRPRADPDRRRDGALDRAAPPGGGGAGDALDRAPSRAVGRDRRTLARSRGSGRRQPGSDARRAGARSPQVDRVASWCRQVERCSPCSLPQPGSARSVSGRGNDRRRSFHG